MKRRRKQRGMGVIEAMIGLSIMSMVIFGSILALLGTMQAWTKGQAKLASEVKSNQAMRIVVGLLRESMTVTVDADGRGLTYQLPARSGNGTYTVPVQWDGVTRRIFVNGSNNLVVSDDTGTRVLLRNIVFQDPSRGTGTYNPFTAGAGSLVRQITVMLVTRKPIRNNQYAYGRVRETVALRNLQTTS